MLFRSPDRVAVFDAAPGASQAHAHASLQALVEEGLAAPTAFVERRLGPGEGRKKLAFLSFSSGTTGRPKVRAGRVEAGGWADGVG